MTTRSFPAKKTDVHLYDSLFCQSCFLDKFKKQLADIREIPPIGFMAFFLIILQGNWSALFQFRPTFKRFVSSNKWLLSKQIIDSFFPWIFFYSLILQNVCVWQDTKDKTIFIRPFLLWMIPSLTIERMLVSMHAQISHFIRSDHKLRANALTISKKKIHKEILS